MRTAQAAGLVRPRQCRPVLGTVRMNCDFPPLLTRRSTPPAYRFGNVYGP
ncbi:hypothetical protein SGL43_05627 [Streptomyces globisporus]|uniref:Uncharacterized protein n=1 Tax=Streptomyces globisporus TaxID=1908 RepID=A0ABN8VBN7_STRGL|nr:hypothetical protein SGL43_05627 [Streptomyces globisporus]